MLVAKYYPPSLSLQTVVTTYYHYAAHIPDRVSVSDKLLGERANIRFLIAGKVLVATRKRTLEKTPSALAFGPNSYPTTVNFKGSFEIFGVGISTVGWDSLFDIPQACLADDVIDFTDLIGKYDSDIIINNLRACMSVADMAMSMDGFLSSRLLKRGGLKFSPAIRAIEDVLESKNINKVEELAEEVDLSLRQLERLTTENFGYSPKLLLRRQRFLRAVKALRKMDRTDWQDKVANEFYDQSHLIKEFHRFAGETPIQMMSRPAPLMNTALNMHMHWKTSQDRQSRSLIDTVELPVAV